MYVVTGATGNTGSVVAEKLLAKGEKVRVIGRDAKRLERFAKKGAEPFVADATSADALTKAFSGAKAVYAIIPPNTSATDVRAYQEQVIADLAAAITKSGVKHAVVLSSFGADKPDKTGPVLALNHLEKKLDAIAGLDALYLRAGYFMENLLPQVGVIQSFGIMAGPVRPDVALPMIATRDVGAVAADALLTLDFNGKQRRELQGPRDATYDQAAKIVGAAIGKPDLNYQQMPAAQLKPALTQMGMSPNMVDLLFEMTASLDAGYMKMLEPRSAANSTPTTLETFVAEVLAPAYKGKSAGA